MKMAVLKVQDSSHPDCIEMESVFSLGQEVTVEYDWAEKENAINGYRNIWHKDKGIFVVKDIFCNMLVNPPEVMITLTTEDENFIKRHGFKEFDVFENLLAERLR